MFDQIAQAHQEITKLTGGIPPDLTGAVTKLVEQGFAPAQITAEMSARGVDVSQFVQNVTPTATAAEPPTNMGAGDLAPVEGGTTNLPEPTTQGAVNPATPKAAAAPAATPASKDTPFDRAYKALAEVGYTEDQILEMTPDDMMRTAERENPAAFPELVAKTAPAATAPAAPPLAGFLDDVALMKQKYGFTDEQIDQMPADEIADTAAQIRKEIADAAEAEAAPESTVADSAVVAPVQQQPAAQGPLADNEQAALRAQFGDDFNVDAMDPNDLQATLRIMRQRVKQGMGPTGVLSALREPSPTEVAYQLLSQRLPDSVLSRMTDQQMMEMAGTLPPLPPAPAASPVGRLVEPAPQPAPAPAQVAQQAPASPAPPPPEPAATTSPVAGLSDAAQVLSDGPGPLEMPAEPAPLNMPADANPYAGDIYMQLAQAAGMGGQVRSQFSPDVVGREAPPPQTVNPQFAAGTAGPNMQVNLGSYVPSGGAPGVMDVGAYVPGGVGPATVRTQWRDEGGNLNTAPQQAAAGGATGGRIIRALMGTPAQGDTPAQLGLLNPAWGQMFSGQDGGMVGKVSRFATSPRTLMTAATIKYLMSNGGLVGQGSPAKEFAGAVMYGTQGNQQDSQQGTTDYANNYEAALRRLSQPMSGPKQDLAPPMVPNYDRPQR
jgi:hypothetical protein